MQNKNFFTQTRWLVTILLLSISTICAWGDETFELVTDVSDLSADDEIIILSSDGSYALSTNQRTSNREAVAPAANNWSISSTTVTLYASTTVQVITLEVYHDDEDDKDYWEFNVGGTNKYLYASGSSSNELKSRSSNASDYNGDWTIELDASYVATIQSIGTNSRRRMRCNTGNNPPIFACYGTSSTTGTLVKIYKKSTAACSADPSMGNASINSSFL